jgi:hypothetical protein
MHENKTSFQIVTAKLSQMKNIDFIDENVPIMIPKNFQGTSTGNCSRWSLFFVLSLSIPCRVSLLSFALHFAKKEFVALDDLGFIVVAVYKDKRC